MSEGTFLGDIPVVGKGFQAFGDAISAPFKDKPKQPTLQAPNALSKQPTQADASATAAQQNLAAEQQQASTSTTLNGGQGLLDTPSTTSQTLMGS